MKKDSMRCVAVLFTVFVSMVFASCGDDEENNAPDNTTISAIPVKSCPDDHHPHWIDLGLPSGTLWACCNEGASSPEAFGGYYQFGQIGSAPSLDQIQEFLDNTTYVWTTQNGVNGGKFTGPNGGTIFLPAAGIVMDGELSNVGSWGVYWSSTLERENRAYYLDFFSGHARWLSGAYRGFGLTVRPVR